MREKPAVVGYPWAMKRAHAGMLVAWLGLLVTCLCLRRPPLWLTATALALGVAGSTWSLLTARLAEFWAARTVAELATRPRRAKRDPVTGRFMPL